MRSIRLRRRPDLPDSTHPSDLADLSEDREPPDLAVSRELLPADHRDRAERPVLARRLRTVAHPRFYAVQVGEPSLAGDVDAAVAHFLAEGVHRGARISGLFNPDVYRRRLAERALGIDAGIDPFLHWLTVGWDERIVPTVLFDEAFYLARHPDLASGPDWAFAQYVRAGCYAAGRFPTPFGPNYGGGPAAPDARERQDPPLVTGLLHRAADFDLARTSWLEEGVAAGALKLAALGSARMRDLVAKATAIEPLIAATPRERWVSWPPHTHPMLMPTARAEQVRRDLGLTRADMVLVVPGGEPGPGLAAALTALREVEPDATLVIATTDQPGSLVADERAVVVDLSGPWSGFSAARRLLGLLDLVRGLQPRRVVVADSELGWRLLSTYGATLHHEMSLAAVLPEPDDETAEADFRGCFDRLDWVVTDTDAQRDDLVARYLLPAVSRARLLSAADCAAGVLATVTATGAGERRA